MEQNRKKRAITQLGWTFAGSLLFAAGVNLIIMPMKLYNGGFMGVAQLIRTFVVSVLHVDAGQIDLAGMIFYILNVPLFYLAWKGNRQELLCTYRHSSNDGKCASYGDSDSKDSDHHRYVDSMYHRRSDLRSRNRTDSSRWKFRRWPGHYRYSMCEGNIRDSV